MFLEEQYLKENPMVFAFLESAITRWYSGIFKPTFKRLQGRGDAYPMPVGSMIRARKEVRERTALEHEKVLTATSDPQSKQAKVRRRQQKVHDDF